MFLKNKSSYRDIKLREIISWRKIIANHYTGTKKSLYVSITCMIVKLLAIIVINSKTLNNNTITSILFISFIFRLITYPIINIILILIIKFFNIIRAYRDISFNSFTLLIKINNLKLYKS